MRDDAVPPVKWSPRLTGATQPPLAYESLWLSLSRLGWLNALKHSRLKALCCRSPYPKEKDLLKTSWVHSEQLAALVGWQLPMAGEEGIERYLGSRTNFWFSTRLRICPLCLEQGYHSVWHQLSSLPACPLDGCQLTEQCQSCGAPLPDYRFSRSLFDRPFYCNTCGKPIAGAPLDPRLLDFRTHPQGLSALAPFNEWLRLVGQHFPLAGVPYPSCGELTRWCRPEALVAAFVQHTTPLPATCSPALYANVCVFRWRVRMKFSPWPKPGAVDFSSLTKVLRSVLRRIVLWILQTRPETDLSVEQAPPLAEDVAVRGAPPEVLAYHLFCLIFCDTCKRPEGRESDLWTFSLRKLPDLNVTYWDHRMPRLGFRALLFGFYAGLYHLVKRAQGVGTINLRRLREVDLVAYSWDIDRTGLASGCVVFPKIHGLPVDFKKARGGPPVQGLLFRPRRTDDGGPCVHTLLPRRPSPELDGRYGCFRYPRKDSLIEAEDDAQAIRVWLSKYHHPKSYGRDRMEVERLLHWAYCHRGKALSSLTPEDIKAYRDYLAQPQAGGRSRNLGWSAGQDHLTARPVSQRLFSSEQSVAIQVIAELAHWLEQVKYCRIEVRPP